MSVFFTSGGGMSKREGRAFAKEVRAGLEKAARDAYRKKLAELEAELAKVRAQGRAKIAEQRTRCAAEVQDTRKVARADAKDAAGRCRAQAREEMRERSKTCTIEARAGAREKIDQKKGACAVESRELREQVRTEAQILADKAQAERDFAAEMRRIEAGNRSREKQRSTAKRGETVKEKIEALEDEIERSAPHLMPYWRKVRNKAAFVQERGRRSAFERLVEQAAEDSEAGHAAEEEADDYVRQLERQQHARGQRERGRGRARGHSNNEVPF